MLKSGRICHYNSRHNWALKAAFSTCVPNNNPRSTSEHGSDSKKTKFKETLPCQNTSREYFRSRDRSQYYPPAKYKANTSTIWRLTNINKYLDKEWILWWRERMFLCGPDWFGERFYNIDHSHCGRTFFFFFFFLKRTFVMCVLWEVSLFGEKVFSQICLYVVEVYCVSKEKLVKEIFIGIRCEGTFLQENQDLWEIRHAWRG